ncbi:tripartite tricarboxylate transporter substrate binding protein [Desulfovibrio sp. OttesenSCG-928-I05]|nr:tripartite tricarboxylate transporter substrate binding protein [Desulfovibrio sp. OttesenSCG-928-I05]
MKKTFSVLACIMALFLCVSGASAANWPAKNITVLVPLAAGGNTDGLARGLIVPALEKAFGVKALVKNVPGGALTLGAAEVANSKPDGYTLMVAPLGPVVLQTQLRTLPYGKDAFAPIYFIANSPSFLIATKDVPSSFDAMIADAKANPGKYVYGSTGPGTVPHINLIALCKQYGVEMKHVPDRSGAEVMKSMASGTTHFFADAGMYIPRYDLQGLVIFSDERHPDFPNIPSAKEIGSDQRFSVWNALYAPAGTPAEILDKIYDACKDLSKDPEAQKFVSGMGAHFIDMTRAEFTDFVNAEYDKFGGIIKEAGIKLE